MHRNTVGGALDLHNLAERVIRPVLEEAGLSWYGWHAYRRGLATNLKSLGVDDLVIQAILRHTDVATTRRSYIKTARPDVVAAAGTFLWVRGMQYVWNLKTSRTVTR